MTNNIVHPTILTLILCEKVIVDAMTSQPSLIGLLTHINAPGFPVKVRPCAVYAEFTGCHGPINLTLRIVDASEAHEPVCSVNLQGNLPDPLAVGVIATGLPPLVFPSEGEYRVQAVTGGYAALERRLIVRKISPRKQ